MGELKLYELGLEDSTELERVKRGYSKLCENPPSWLKFNELSDRQGHLPGLNLSNQKLVVVGSSLDEIHGYMKFARHKCTTNIGFLTEMHLEMGDYRFFIRTDGKLIDAKGILEQKGFEDYDGSDVIDITFMESFRPHNGIGAKMINHVKSKEGIGMIQLGAYPQTNSKSFYEKQGFIDTKLRVCDRDFDISNTARNPEHLKELEDHFSIMIWKPE